MSKLKLLTIGVIGLLLLNLALVSYLFFNNPKRPSMLDGRPLLPPRAEPKMIVIDKLHFTEDQIAAYEKLIQQHRKSVDEKDAAIKELKNKLYATLQTNDTTSVAQLKATIGGLQQEIETIHYSHFAEIKKICKPEQLVHFNELTKELADFFGQKNRPPHP